MVLLVAQRKKTVADIDSILIDLSDLLQKVKHCGHLHVNHRY